MRVHFNAKCWHTPTLTVTTTVTTIQQAEAESRKAQCWELEIVGDFGADLLQTLGTVSGDAISPALVGASLRVALAGKDYCPTLERTVDLVNAFWQSEVLTRRTLQQEERRLLK